MAEHHVSILFCLAIALLTFNFGLSIHLSGDDVESEAFTMVSYFLVLLLCAWRFGFYRARHDNSSAGLGYQCLKAAVLCLASLLAVLLLLLPAYRLVRLAPPQRWTPLVLLVAAAGATALGLGGCCAFLLHRDDWSKQPSQEVILPLALESPRHACAH